MKSRRTLIYSAVGALIILVVVSLLMASKAKQTPEESQLSTQQNALAHSPYADPILKYLPYGDIGYNITPVIKSINGKQRLTIEVDIKFAGSDYNSTADQRQKTIETYERAALNYLRSKGFDPKKYRIVFKTP